MDLCPAAQKHFGSFARVLSLSIPDLYGGKICAALDRQHPRDLFDIKLLIDETGITPEIRQAFVIFLAGHNRPINELLSPNLLDIKQLYDDQFAGMSRDEVALLVLQKIQKELPCMLVQSLDKHERQFLLSMKLGEPEWRLLRIDNLELFPSLQWKLMNIRKMDSTKRASEFRKLQKILL